MFWARLPPASHRAAVGFFVPNPEKRFFYFFSHPGRGLLPKWEDAILLANLPGKRGSVRVFNTNTLLAFGRDHTGSEEAFRELTKTLRQANWNSFEDVQKAYPLSRAIKGDRVVFNVKGNLYRVVAAIDYKRKGVFIKFVGTHAEYDKIDALTVNRY